MKNINISIIGLLILALVIALVTPLLLTNSYQLRLLVVVAIYSLLTLGLNFMLGYTGLLSLAQVGFFCIGAYTTAILTVDLQISFWLTIIIGMAVSALIAIILGRPVLKLKSHYFMFATFVIAELCEQIAMNWDSLTHGATGIAGIPRPDFFGYMVKSNVMFYYLVIGFVIIGVFVAWRVQYSKLGRALMAIRESEVAAQTMGIKIDKTKQTAFTLSAIFASVAGSLYASFSSVISPDIFSFEVTIVVLVSLLLGGSGSIAGAIIGTIIVYLMPEWLRVAGDYYMIIYGAGVILLMIFMPRGLVGILDDFRLKRAKTQDYSKQASAANN